MLKEGNIVNYRGKQAIVYEISPMAARLAYIESHEKTFTTRVGKEVAMKVKGKNFSISASSDLTIIKNNIKLAQELKLKFTINI